MRKLFVLFVIALFLLSVTPAFAATAAKAGTNVPQQSVFQKIADCTSSLGKTDKPASAKATSGPSKSIFQSMFNSATNIGKKEKTMPRMETGKAKTNPLQAMYEGAANMGTPCPPDKKPAAAHTAFQTAHDDVGSIGKKGTVPAVKNTVFQKASGNISTWNKDSKLAEPYSLRNNKAELARRMLNKSR